MQQSRRAAQTMIRIASIKNWCLELLTRFQFVAKIKWVEAAGHAHRIELVALDGNSPRTRPRQRAKPDFPVLLIGDDWPGAGLARVARNRKPRIRLMTGRSSPAFDHPRSADDWLLIQRPLARPAARQITQRVSRGRERPLRGSSLFNRDRLLLFVLNDCRTCKDTALGIDRITQCHVDFARNILQQHIE